MGVLFPMSGEAEGGEMMDKTQEILQGMHSILKEWEDAWDAGFPDGINSTRMMLFGSFCQLAREAREVVK